MTDALGSDRLCMSSTQTPCHHDCCQGHFYQDFGDGQAACRQQGRCNRPTCAGSEQSAETRRRTSACRDRRSGITQDARLEVGDGVLDDGHAVQVAQGGLVADVAVHEHRPRRQVQQHVGLHRHNKKIVPRFSLAEPRFAHVMTPGNNYNWSSSPCRLRTMARLTACTSKLAMERVSSCTHGQAEAHCTHRGARVGAADPEVVGALARGQVLEVAPVLVGDALGPLPARVAGSRSRVHVVGHTPGIAHRETILSA